MSRLRQFVVLSAMAVALPGPIAAQTESDGWIGRFAVGSEAIPAPWRVETVGSGIPPTAYRVRSWEGVSAVEARAEKSMAILVRPVEVDLARTPILCWRWRVEATVATADLHTKQGDDYAARLYLMYRVDPAHLSFGTRTKLALARAARGDQVPDAAVNYIWDNRATPGTIVPNAYTERAMMWVLRSGDAEARRWVTERRNVAADFEKAFGHPPARLFGIGLASDTDNTGGSALAGFADIRFVQDNMPCP